MGLLYYNCSKEMGQTPPLAGRCGAWERLEGQGIGLETLWCMVVVSQLNKHLRRKGPKSQKGTPQKNPKIFEKST